MEKRLTTLPAPRIKRFYGKNQHKGCLVLFLQNILQLPYVVLQASFLLSKSTKFGFGELFYEGSPSCLKLFEYPFYLLSKQTVKEVVRRVNNYREILLIITRDR